MGAVAARTYGFPDLSQREPAKDSANRTTGTSRVVWALSSTLCLVPLVFRHSFGDNGMFIGLAVSAAVASTLGVAAFRIRPVQTAQPAVLGGTCSYLAMIAFDAVAGGQSHELLPLEVVYAASVMFVGASAAAAMMALVSRNA